MKIEPADYDIESFLEYLVLNTDKVFMSGVERKWLKSHLLYVRKGWQDVFQKYRLEKWGKVWHFAIPESATSLVDYYAYEWDENLVSCFTASTEETYENTLRRVVDGTRGISEAWIKPNVFEQLKNFLLSEYGASIYHFISTRSKYSDLPTRVDRPDFARRMNYSGEDAGEVLKETQTLYGTLPKSIDFNVSGEKMQFNRNGLTVIRNVSRRTTGILIETTATILTEQVQLLKTSERFRTSQRTIGEGAHAITIPSLVAGKIRLGETRFNPLKARQLFGESGELEESQSQDDELDRFDFSFIDTYVADNEYSATVVDEQKGTVFGLSGDAEEMALVPKHRTTFESFVRFYQEILEGFDRSAQLMTFNEQLSR